MTAIVSWNVHSLRMVAARYPGGTGEMLRSFHSPFALCLQEHKLGGAGDAGWSQLAHVEGYESFWAYCTGNPGHHGVATWVRKGYTRDCWRWFPDEACACDKCQLLEREGRVLITLHHGFAIMNLYLCSGSSSVDKPERDGLREELLRRVHLQVQHFHQQGVHVVLLGDLNLLRAPEDHWNFEGQEKRRKSTQPRSWWLRNVLETELRDSYRHFYPTQRGAYTFFDGRGGGFGERGQNQGQRKDYIYVSPALLESATEARIHQDVQGSDHVPCSLNVGVELVRAEGYATLSSENVAKQGKLKLVKGAKIAWPEAKKRKKQAPNKKSSLDAFFLPKKK